MELLINIGRKCRRLLSIAKVRVLPRSIDDEWRGALPEECKFWEDALRNPARHWSSEEFRARTDPELPLQEELRQLIEAPPGSVVRILDVGAGPLTRLGKKWPGRDLQIVPVDPLAPQYDAMLLRLGLKPLVRTVAGDGERLLESFSANDFDLAYASNALDHSYDPLKAIAQMLAVVKPGSYVYLWHFANEGAVEAYEGLHQWNFNIRKGELMISDGRQATSVTARLKGIAETQVQATQGFGKAVVIARLRKTAAT